MTRVPESAELLRRAVPLTGTHNFRDIGGYETEDCGMTRWGRLYRSDALHNLDPGAQQMLTELGLRTVIDLRSEHERANFPDALPSGGPTAFVCPLLDNATLDPVPTSLTEVYNHLIDHRGAAIVTAIRAMTTSDALPAVLHCTAGKDRTGVVVALLLSSLGVPDEVVASDFAATELFLTEEFLSVLMVGTSLSADSPMLGANASLMHDLLARVRAEYGSAARYLTIHGLTEYERDWLRAQLITRDGR